jgi:hypothetical protein
MAKLNECTVALKPTKTMVRKLHSLYNQLDDFRRTNETRLIGTDIQAITQLRRDVNKLRLSIETRLDSAGEKIA